MTTQAAFPTPVGPFGLEGEAEATAPQRPVGAESELDALPVLDHRLHAQTIPPQHAVRGAYLVLHDGDRTRLLPLRQDIIHLGRGSFADVRFEDHRVSRDHAILVRHGRYFRLLDNRSANGTFVNGRMSTAVNITSGDVLELGPIRLEFLEVD